MTTKAIEAGARALVRTFCDHWFGAHGQATHYKMTRDFVNGSDAWQAESKACIEAAIASGELVPASAVAAERERCAKSAEQQAIEFLSPEYASNQPLGSLCERFACEQVAEAIRALEPASGEYFLVARDMLGDIARVVEIADRSEYAPEISRVKAMLAATSNGSGK